MQINIYNQFYSDYFNSEKFKKDFDIALRVLKNGKSLFFIGNGGSMAICSHMMEDFAKIGRFRTYAFSDAALISCYSNDYGYENAIAEWLKIYMQEGDVLVAISSSGNSANINNAALQATRLGGKIITLSGFKPENILRNKGEVNFHLPIENYGVVECFHQVILHSLLDQLIADKL